jgi:hypothetical protein
MYAHILCGRPEKQVTPPAEAIMVTTKKHNPKSEHLAKLARRLKDHADIYKIDPQYGTVSVDTNSPNAAKEITNAVNRFFVAIHEK